MKKTNSFSRFFLFFLFIINALDMYSQTEKFDIVSFTPPANWQKSMQTGMLTFTDANKTTGAFCNLILINSSPGSGNPQTDFKEEWKRLIVTPYNATENPSTESEDKDGWKTITGAATVQQDGIGYYIFLTVYSGFGKKMSLITQTNDQAYFATIDGVLRNMKLDKQTSITSTITNKQTDGKSSTYGNIIYTLPAGWTSSNNQKFLELFPQSLVQNENFSIILLPGKSSVGSLQQELALCWNEFAGILGAQTLREVNGNNYNQDDVSRTFSGWEYIAGHGSIRTNSDFFVHAYIIRAKDRIERVVVLSKEIRLDAMRSNIDPTKHHYPYYATITDFIFNLRFANLSSPDLPKATWKGAGILGVWAGLGFSGGSLKTTYAIFFSNGQVFYGNPFPVQGLYDLDTYAEKERSKRNWGTYSFQNGKGTVSMPYGNFPIRIEAGKLVMSPIREEHNFIRMAVIDDIKLSGTWMIEDKTGKIVTITFKPDGSFTDNGALRVLDHTLYDYYSVADGGGAGKYLIKDHTIIFMYSDGRILPVAFPGMGFIAGNNSPKELILSYNNDKFIKQ